MIHIIMSGPNRVISKRQDECSKYPTTPPCCSPLSTFPSSRSLYWTACLFSFRTNIEDVFEWTPLHMACSWERDEIAFFLIKEEQKRITKERQEGRDGQPGRRQQQGTPSYNMRTTGGYSPVFLTSSSKIVEEMVKSFPDLELENGYDGKQLLERGEHGPGKLSPSKC